MAQEIVLYTKCPQCNGTGMHQAGTGPNAEGSIVCNWPGCVNGYIALSKFTLDPGGDDILNKCNDILDKCNDILEELGS